MCSADANTHNNECTQVSMKCSILLEGKHAIKRQLQSSFWHDGKDLMKHFCNLYFAHSYTERRPILLPSESDGIPHEKLLI